MTLLVLARHGRTALNAEGRLRGLANPPLDRVGEAEASRLAVALAAIPEFTATRVLSSPLQRATRTAEAIAATLGVPHEADPRFNDRDYGAWTGHPKTDVVAEFGSVDAAPGVEPTSDVLERVLPALADVVADGPLVVVTHDAVIRPVLQAIDPSLTELVVDTASWNLLERVGDAWVVRSTDNKPATP
ncbi:MAG: histidine phosphatase family protein [Herbiconiux sp.]|uniref:histidine phosphatase family protein n=1 Tax=Herbiconiux sp. TaxID=1871186 RepID=UPI0011F66C6C|nr:histidine phosphatase family protein [Herbiconiux sp.]TAJ48112.1 MAG: histidine phosphatase family protein [Herbiconiux sp.]